MSKDSYFIIKNRVDTLSVSVMQAAIEASAQSLLIRDNIQLVNAGDAAIDGLINENFKLSWDKVNPVNGMLNFLLPYPDVI